MDGQRFDRLTRELTARFSRRRFAGVLATLGLGASLGFAGETAAKNKKGKKKKPKKCKNGAVKCGKVCVNTKTNALHCGRCGRSCGINVACVNGACEGGGCPDDQILCGTLCVDPDDDDAHCGRCHNPCPGDLTCIGGECGCAEDTRCGNECVDTQTDPDHCNGCNQACGAGVSCVGGACNPSGCDAGEIDCGGGLCIPDVEHACCNPADCGGSNPGTLGIQCNETTHRCECETAGWGICQRFENKAGVCGRCCPGADTQLGEKCLSDDDDLICIDQTDNGCACPPDKPQHCFSLGARNSRCSADLKRDRRACLGFCAPCGDRQACCDGQCVGRCPRGQGVECRSHFLPCGPDCENCPQEKPFCCDTGTPDHFGGCSADRFCQS